MKHMNVARKFALGLFAMAAAASANAAVSEEITKAIKDSGADAAVVGGLVLVVMVGIAGFKWLRKAV
ncbi:methyltransferase [Chromobacterium sp. Rain0013]|nr:methyltransferase [Chromobacterium sp. Rain0013]